MGLPASSTISMSQVSVELGRASSATTSLGESAVRTLAGVPSGAIAFTNLHGKSAFTPGFAGDFSAFDTAIQPGPITTQLHFNTDGTVSGDVAGGSAWGSPTGGTPGNSYYIKATLSSGTTPSGPAMGSVNALSSQVSWTITRSTTVGTTAGSIDVSIYTDAGGTNLVAGPQNYSITAQITSNA